MSPMIYRAILRLTAPEEFADRTAAPTDNKED
ncbi:hypothetical protein Tam10B_1463 [Bifidobacterium vansinderenii]|uniref:Uncharacterized protein n=1 Tax=Bifidobacterium vansinderenii TaxID=1984871 RepID=A0A229VXX0_9BIFI|nr:hypothetical protein Tam10B_1463 [Bifidobacterium vansinderenii]